MISRVSHRERLSLNKKVNPYKACIYELCRDFLDGVGYDLGTKIILLIYNCNMWVKTILYNLPQKYNRNYITDPI